MKLADASFPPPKIWSLCTMHWEQSPSVLPEVKMLSSESLALSGTTAAAFCVLSVSSVLSRPQPTRKLLPITRPISAKQRADIRPTLDWDRGTTSPWWLRTAIFGCTVGGWIQGPAGKWADGLTWGASFDPMQ